MAPRNHRCSSGSGSGEPPAGAEAGDPAVTPGDESRAVVLPGGSEKHQGQVEMTQRLCEPQQGPQGGRWTTGDLHILSGGDSSLVQHCLRWFTYSYTTVIQLLMKFDFKYFHILGSHLHYLLAYFTFQKVHDSDLDGAQRTWLTSRSLQDLLSVRTMSFLLLLLHLQTELAGGGCCFSSASMVIDFICPD